MKEEPKDPVLFVFEGRGYTQSAIDALDAGERAALQLRLYEERNRPRNRRERRQLAKAQKRA